MKDRIIKGIKTLFKQQEENYCKLVVSVIFRIMIMLNMKVVAIEIKAYQ